MSFRRRADEGKGAKVKACLYTNGTILTMESTLAAEAVLTVDGRIHRVGTLDEVRLDAPAGTKEVDLGIMCSCPRSSIPTAISPPTRTPSRSSSSRARQDLTNSSNGSGRSGRKNGWGRGLDQRIRLRPHRAEGTGPSHPPPSRPGRSGKPVVIAHASGHMGVLNTAALQALITADTPDPEGGVIGREEDGSPSGYLEETAFTSHTARIPQPTLEQLGRQLGRRAADLPQPWHHDGTGRPDETAGMGDTFLHGAGRPADRRCGGLRRHEGQPGTVRRPSGVCAGLPGTSAPRRL